MRKSKVHKFKLTNIFWIFMRCLLICMEFSKTFPSFSTLLIFSDLYTQGIICVPPNHLQVLTTVFFHFWINLVILSLLSFTWFSGLGNRAIYFHHHGITLQMIWWIDTNSNIFVSLKHYLMKKRKWWNSKMERLNLSKSVPTYFRRKLGKLWSIWNRLPIRSFSDFKIKRIFIF